ncbi:hypothetical protein TWF106_006567 [Orbilia oligospora]|uniref:Signal recognition particle receptor subunit beta n=1 Tax=Orbilia oligospora TaxID=2813651 RepID=A0A7C8QR51_ORBOL|nr:hypothetical protein TWF106_006567 [Orbilia oligospora]
MSTLPTFEILGFPVSLPILIISLLAIVIIPIILDKLLTPGSKTGPSSVILLAGPRDAGKTSLLLYLQEKTLIPTQTSTTPAIVKLPPSALSPAGSEDDGSTKPFHLKDTPGHPKLRSTAMNTIIQPAESCIGVVYVLDSAVLSTQARITDTTGYLYELLLAIQKRYAVLSESNTSTEPIPLLIACNKNDLFTALPSTKISNLLQTELSRMKETKRKGLLGAGAGENDDEDLDLVLGDEASDQITWEGLKEFGVEISIQSGSVKSGNIDGWKSWMAACLDA